MQEKTVVFFRFSTYKVTRLFCKQGYYVNKGQPIFEYREEASSVAYQKMCPFLYEYAEDNSILKSVNVKENDIIVRGTPMYSYQSIARDDNFEMRALEYRKSIIELTEFVRVRDDFTNDIFIKANNIAGKEGEYIKTFIVETQYTCPLYFSLESFNGRPYLNFRSVNPHTKLNKNDEIIFLFESQIKLNLVFITKPSGSDGIKGNSIPISYEILQTLLTKNLLKWRYNDNKANVYLIGAFSCNEEHRFLLEGQYSSIIEAQYLLRFYTAKFIEANKPVINKESPAIG